MISKKKKFEWTEEGLVAFYKLKEMLTSLLVLAYPDHEKQFFVECDASNYTIEGALSQKGYNGTLHPIYYYSKTLSKAEVNYSITEKELLAIKTAFTEWRHLLQGAKHKIIVYSDHRNLLFAIKPQLLTPRQIRWQELLATYWFEIVYSPGKKNGKTDALSRVETEKTEGKEFDKDSLLKPEQLVGFDDVDSEASYLALATNFVDDIKQTYRQDKMAQELFKDLAEDSRNNYNKKHWLEVDGLLVRKENPEQVYVPMTFRKTIIQLNHDSEYARHLGIDKTSDLVSRNFYWPKMRKDISNYVKACKTCPTKKDDRHKEYGNTVRVPVAELP
jgi:hypothetical protein